MKFLDYLKSNTVIFDGAMGSQLINNGLKPGEMVDTWNKTHSDIVTSVHKSYVKAGADVITTNTFGLNELHYSKEEIDDLSTYAINNAKASIEEFENKFIAYDIGPLGRMLKPWGDLSFEKAVEYFATQVNIAKDKGIDLFIIETMNDALEAKAAILAVKENSDLPLIISNVYDNDGHLLTGTDVKSMVCMCEALGVDVIGANCSLGPNQLLPIAKELVKYSSIPVIIQPNAGMPKLVDGKTIYDVTDEEFSDVIKEMVMAGVRIVGGCCGTTPSFIEKINEKIKDIKPKEITKKNYSWISSYGKTVEFKDMPVIIGERINPTGKKLLKEAIANGDTDYILREAISQEEKGAEILDVNVGVPGLDEVANLTKAVFEIQSITTLPLQIDTSNEKALESALRIYNGKPLINSVNGKEESMKAIFPLAKKYGGMIVCLCLDEDGIPETAKGRLDIAKKILDNAKSYGINKEDLIFDALTMPVSANSDYGRVTLETMKLIKEKLGCKTILGVSNVSFGLPNRDKLNAAFLTLAYNNGLDSAIINPLSQDMMNAHTCYLALNGQDKTFEKYISFNTQEENKANNQTDKKNYSLKEAIIKGLKDEAIGITKSLLCTYTGLDIINMEIVPALDTVGLGFENKTIYLPSLLLSAEAAQGSFEVIKNASKTTNDNSGEAFVIATVKGDIHDIGKNIVKLILSNYNYNIIDLGKDVASDIIVNEVIRTKSKYCGLSALMVTTVPAMEKTIKELNEKAPWCKVMVGGAVVTQEYADKIGADYYAKDAMMAVKLLEEK